LLTTTEDPTQDILHGWMLSGNFKHRSSNSIFLLLLIIP